MSVRCTNWISTENSMGATDNRSQSAEPSDRTTPETSPSPELPSSEFDDLQHHGIEDKKYIVSLDVGTTTIRCFVYDEKAKVCSKAEENVVLVYPTLDRVEIDPDDLWQKCLIVIKKAIHNAGLTASQVHCMGLTTQRATFITWDRKSGEPLHNFITWKDRRADTLVKEYNNSWMMMGLRIGSTILHKILRKSRYLAASVIRFANIQVTMRLKWVVENNERLKDLLKTKDVLFGTVDTWLLYKLTQGKVHATDYSNASGTGFFDPFVMQWNSFFCKFLNLPMCMLPEVRDSVGDWGTCPVELFGAVIPITAVVSDQGASLFGLGGIARGEVKVTLGTGAFLNVNTGTKSHASVAGIYPVIGWKDREGIAFMAEGSSNDNGTIVDWGKQVGFYNEPAETAALAASVPNTNGVYFIPGFQGIQAPVNDTFATGGFLGLNAEVEKAHLVRAMLESLAFRVAQIFETMRKEAKYELFNVSEFSVLRVDGGVARNDFIVQLIATLTNKSLERPKSIDTSALGCAFLAGLGAGVWGCRAELESLREIDRVFHPDKEQQSSLLDSMQHWERAMNRFTKWHKESILNKDTS